MSSFSQGTGYAHNLSLSQGAGLSLSQPVVDSIYSTPVDSLPENVVQRISSQMPPHRVIGQRIIKANARPRAPSPSPKPPLTPVREGEDEVIQPGDAHRDIATILKQMAAFKSDLLGLHGLVSGDIEWVHCSCPPPPLQLLENNVGEMEGGGDQLPLEVANADMLAKEKEIAELQDSVVLLREQLEKVKLCVVSVCAGV